MIDTRRHTPKLWLAGFVALVGAVNLVVLLAQAPALVRSFYLNADNATALVLPALASHAAAGSIINMGNHPWYEPWWFMRATAGISGYHGLWEAAPFLFGLLSIAVVAACTWWALGRVAGLLCAVVLLSTSEALRDILYVPESHGAIALHVGVLCGALLIVYREALRARARPAVLLLVGIPLVVFTGAGLTDQLLLISGLAPFILAPLLCRVRFGSEAWRIVSLFALVTGILSGLLALLLTHIMQEQHVIHAPFPVTFVGSNAILKGLQNLIVTFASLGGGAFFGEPANDPNVLTFVLGALTLLAFAAILRALWRWSGSTGRSSEPHSQREGLRELFLAYWGIVLVATVAAFALTSVSGSTSNGRYLIGAWWAMAALLGILTTTPVARTVLLVGVGLFGMLNVRAELVNGVQPAGVGPNQRLADVIEHFAMAHGTDIGYSGYWDTAPVTWETRLRIAIYPVTPCAAPTGLCPFYAANISTWYDTRADTRTFLLTDARPGVPSAVTVPPKSLGRPLAKTYVGEGMTMYVYNHDIAADLSG
ncbi:MAG: hypothetical protein ACLQQB_11000 [Solirubrobacteraceae bacterium]